MSAPSGTPAPVVSLTDVSVHRGSRLIVPSVSLDVHEGDVVALLGPNGAGKSTLLEAIGGVIGSTGSITRRGRVATVLQTPGLASRSVQANVDLAQSWWGVPRGERAERTRAALAGLQAEHLARRHASALSGGEARRVHLARGVAVQPDLLLLDEPFAGLDAETHTALVEDTATVLRRAARATVVVLHERSDAWALADRILVLMEGRIVADAAPDTLLREPPSLEVARFLGYDGELVEDGELVLTRSPQVRIAPDGPLEATVTRRVRREDGVLLELELTNGRLRCGHADPAVAVGDRLRVALDHAVRFPAPPHRS